MSTGKLMAIDIKRDKGYNKISPDGLQANNSVKALSVGRRNEV